jgi:hypothetical protein
MAVRLARYGRNFAIVTIGANGGRRNLDCQTAAAGRIRCAGTTERSRRPQPEFGIAAGAEQRRGSRRHPITKSGTKFKRVDSTARALQDERGEGLW